MLAWFYDLRLSWKIILAPAFLTLVLIGVGGYALQMQHANQATVDALIAGPVHQAEVVADFDAMAWAVQARLYHLTATAANETDEKKIKAAASRTATALAGIGDKLKDIEALKTEDPKSAEAFAKLKTVVATYTKQAKSVIDMADSDAGAALMFMMGAERSFGEIDKLTDELTEASKSARDREVARAATAIERQGKVLVGVLFAAVVLGCLVSFLVSGGIARPVVQIAATIKRIAQGDLGAEVPASGRRDEIGVISQAVQVFRDTMIETDRLRDEQTKAAVRAEEEKKRAMHRMADDFQAAVGAIVDTVSTSATELEATATVLTGTAETTQQLAEVVASASSEASANVESVASASEELASSIAEIGRQVQQSSQIAGAAVRQAEATDSRIAQLSQAAGRIGDVVKLITAIAEQTNLLALNATIEAARAGEAGKGFAVVASEVKSLANQTAKATEEIGAQIANMQTATRESVAAIKEIGATIRQVSDIALSIASAVEQQGAATRDIAGNVQRAAAGTSRVAANIGDVNRGASDTGSASVQVLSSAKALAAEGNKLKLEVDRFLAGVRVA